VSNRCIEGCGRRVMPPATLCYACQPSARRRRPIKPRGTSGRTEPTELEVQVVSLLATMPATHVARHLGISETRVRKAETDYRDVQLMKGLRS